MSVAFNKFDIFVQDIGTEAHQLDTDDLYILLTNSAPSTADTHIDTTTTPCQIHPTSSGTEVAAATGYTKGGAQVASNAYSQTGGTAKLTGNAVTVTCGSTSGIGPFQYAILYNATAGSTDARPVIGWWNYGSAVTLANGETFTIGNSNNGGNWDATYPILTLA